MPVPARLRSSARMPVAVGALKADLLAGVRAFLEVVGERTGKRVLVYASPGLESRCRVVAVMDRRLWVRRLGSTPPSGDWWMWQRDDRAQVDGIRATADLNVLAG